MPKQNYKRRKLLGETLGWRQEGERVTRGLSDHSNSDNSEIRQGMQENWTG